MERINPDRGSYTQRELLPLLRVKPHVLRYWEQTLPLVRSRRDDAGRRVWSAGQVRMLVRIRHLVVNRGVSVPAAGEALLREAGGETARVKAGLEGVRNALVVLLIKVQSRAGGAGVAGEAGEARRAAPREEGDPPAAEEHSGRTDCGIQVESLVDRGIIPPCPPDLEEGEYRAAPVRLVSRSGEGSPDSVPFVYSHLFARGEPTRVASMLAALIRYRVREPGPLVIAVPEGEEPLYRSHFPENALVLGVPRLQYGKIRYDAPTLSVLATIASNRELDRYMQRHDRETIYLWAADNPHSTVIDYLSARARHERSGLVLGVHPGVTGYRLAESAGLYLPVWRPRFGETARCGRWLRESGAPRYRLWLRDLARLDAPGVLVPAAAGPSVWRGSSWDAQVRLVWPDVPF